MPLSSFVAPYPEFLRDHMWYKLPDPSRITDKNVMLSNVVNMMND